MRQPKDITHNGQTLDVILEKHMKWVNQEDGGERANLQDADLRSADLRGADLQGAYLQDADLRSADLLSADLQGANLQDADLRSANLRSADLQGANLRGADLRSADLWGADLQGTDLQDADLRGADLQGADLQGAYLLGANLGYSCWPLWCGSLDVKIDKAIFCQLVYHLCRVEIVGEEAEDMQAVQGALGYIANQFKRVAEGSLSRVIETDEED